MEHPVASQFIQYAGKMVYTHTHTHTHTRVCAKATSVSWIPRAIRKNYELKKTVNNSINTRNKHHHYMACGLTSLKAQFKAPLTRHFKKLHTAFIPLIKLQCLKNDS
jgi:hypothetical protein